MATDETVCLQISHVFGLWVELKKKSGFQRTPSLTEKRRKFIKDVVSSKNYEDIKKVFKYLCSDDKYAIYMRENKYVELENIFRKWEQKVSKANHYFENAPIVVKKQDFFVPYSIVDRIDGGEE